MTDHARSPRPAAILTGDSLLVGDVARPDLAVEAEAGARDLFASLRQIAALGDDVEVWPAHVGGSLCGGGALSGRTVSTVGQERRANRAFGLADEAAFVTGLTQTLPPRPANVAHVVSLNRHPRAPSGEPPALSIRDVRRLMVEGAVLVNGRAAEAFDAVHVPGAICLPAERPGVGTRAGWVLASRPPIVTMGRDEAEARRLARLLQAVGMDDVRGVLAEGIAGWRGAGLGTASTPVVELGDLARALDRGEMALVDVRDPDEWDACHVGEAVHLPLPSHHHGRPRGARPGPPRRRGVRHRCPQRRRREPHRPARPSRRAPRRPRRRRGADGDPAVTTAALTPRGEIPPDETPVISRSEER